MKHLIFCCIFLCSYHCTNPSQPASTVQIPKDSVTEKPNNPCETIDWASDTLFKSTEPNFKYEPLRGAGGGFSQKISLKNGFLGVIGNVVVDNNTIAVFQTDSLQHWIQVYCGPLEAAMAYDVKMPDLNFDGHKDLLIDAHSGGNFGKSSVGFLFDPLNQTFKRAPALDLENMNIDTKNKCLRARHYSSPYGGICKWMYGWEGDSLVMLGEAIYHAEVSATVTLKKRQKDGTYKIEVIEDEMERAWDVFEKCLWRGDFSID